MTDQTGSGDPSAAQNANAVTRRKFMKLAGGAAAAGLVVGGGLGFAGGYAAAPDDTTGSSRGTASLKPIHVGAAISLTGAVAADGLEHKQGIELAVKEWNARGGVGGRKVDLTVQDWGDMAPETVVPVFRNLIDQQHVDAIITGYNLYAGPDYDVAGSAQVPYLSVSTRSTLAEYLAKDPAKYASCFQCVPLPSVYGTGFSDFIQTLEDEKKFVPKTKKIAIIYANNNYCVEIATAARASMNKIGWTISFYQQVVSPVSEWGAILRKLHNDPPDIVFLSDQILGDSGSFTIQFAQDPIPALLYAQYCPSTDAYIKLCKKAADGVVWCTLTGVVPGEPGDTFKKSFEETYGEPPGPASSGYTYDMTNLYLTAAAEVGDPADRQGVSKAILDMWHRGVNGTYRFEENHTALSYPGTTSDPAGGLTQMYYQIRDGKQVHISPPIYSNGEFVLPSWM